MMILNNKVSERYESFALLRQYRSVHIDRELITGGSRDTDTLPQQSIRTLRKFRLTKAISVQNKFRDIFTYIKANDRGTIAYIGLSIHQEKDFSIKVCWSNKKIEFIWTDATGRCRKVALNDELIQSKDLIKYYEKEIVEETLRSTKPCSSGS